MWFGLGITLSVFLVETVTFASARNVTEIHNSTSEVKTEKGNISKGTQEKVPRCKDILGRRQCKLVKKRYANIQICEVNSLMKKYCRRFCGFCQAAPPLECSLTSFGCCWDKVTTKIDLDGSNCPVCRDYFRYMCKRFEPDCLSKKTVGEYIRRACPETCGRCKSKCYDFASTTSNCRRWANRGMCRNRKSLMNVLCKRTCKFC